MQGPETLADIRKHLSPGLRSSSSSPRPTHSPQEESLSRASHEGGNSGPPVFTIQILCTSILASWGPCCRKPTLKVSFPLPITPLDATKACSGCGEKRSMGAAHSGSSRHGTSVIFFSLQDTLVPSKGKLQCIFLFE